MTGVICPYDCANKNVNGLCCLEAIILVANDNVNTAVRCKMKVK